MAAKGKKVSVVNSDNVTDLNKNKVERDIIDFLNNDKDLKLNVGFLTESGANVKHWFDTNSLTWNFVSSGRLRDGLPFGRVLEVHGETTTGKSLLSAQIAAMASRDPKTITVFFDPEYGMDKKFIERLGGNPGSIITPPEIGTIEKFNKVVTKYMEYIALKKLAEEYRIVMILDSLAMLSSEQEIKSPDKNDMTKAKKIRQFFRSYMDECVRHGILFFVVNQVYQNIGQMFGPSTVPGGGMGLPYAASQRYALSQPKLEKKDDQKMGDVEGTKVKLKTLKNRVSIPLRSAYIRFTYEHGLDRYGGLWELIHDGDKGQYGPVVTALNLAVREGNRYVIPGIIEEKFYEKEFVDAFKQNEERNIDLLQEIIDVKTAKKEITSDTLTSEEKKLLVTEDSLVEQMEGIER